MVMKGYPWFDLGHYGSNGPEAAKRMAAAGINVVRLGWMWAGAFPEEGQFNGWLCSLSASIC